MLGYPPKVLLRAVESKVGPDGVARVREIAGFPEEMSFRMSRNYGPEAIDALAGAAGTVLGLDADEVVDFWVDAFFADLVRRWPVWFESCTSARELLELQPEIHNSFAKACSDPDASREVTEKFQLERLDRATVVRYRSPHRLCRVYTGMAQKVLAHYGDAALIEERSCQRRGDDHCEIHIQWL